MCHTCTDIHASVQVCRVVGCRVDRTRPIWLILPVVICFFQGLSHANVSGTGGNLRRDCVRLIRRLMVYPTSLSERSLALRDNCPNRAANTWLTNRAPIDHADGRRSADVGVLDASGRIEDQSPTSRDPRRQMQLLTQANVAEARITMSASRGVGTARRWTNSPPIRYEGSVVDYLASDG